MEVIKPGVHYTVTTTDGKQINLVFCHRDENKTFIDGVTSEDILGVLLDRYRHFSGTVDSPENINTFLHLRQALHFLQLRKKKKMERKAAEKKQ